MNLKPKTPVQRAVRDLELALDSIMDAYERVESDSLKDALANAEGSVRDAIRDLKPSRKRRI